MPVEMICYRDWENGLPKKKDWTICYICKDSPKIWWYRFVKVENLEIMKTLSP